jgi:hypothetical protein
MENRKKEVKEDLTENNDGNDSKDKEHNLDGKKLYDLYRCTTKLIE